MLFIDDAGRVPSISQSTRSTYIAGLGIPPNTNRPYIWDCVGQPSIWDCLSGHMSGEGYSQRSLVFGMCES